MLNISNVIELITLCSTVFKAGYIIGKNSIKKYYIAGKKCE